jgi:hypothetical protein
MASIFFLFDLRFSGNRKTTQSLCAQMFMLIFGNTGMGGQGIEGQPWPGRGGQTFLCRPWPPWEAMRVGAAGARVYA